MDVPSEHPETVPRVEEVSSEQVPGDFETPHPSRRWRYLYGSNLVVKRQTMWYTPELSENDADDGGSEDGCGKMAFLDAPRRFTQALT
jgi:hypothetical protein